MELILTKEQLDELFSSDPREEMEMTEEELQAWQMQQLAETEYYESLNPYFEF